MQAYNLVAQRDGELARVDNMTMKTIAAVTLAFLPGTFIAVGFKSRSSLFVGLL